MEPPEDLASPNYPEDAHAELLERAKASWFDEMNGPGWEDQGERSGVQLFSKPDPKDPTSVPAVKGTTRVANCTSDEFMSVIQLPGMRKRWDARFQDGFMLRRYNLHSYAFYTIMRGMSWVVYPRDIVGVQKNYRQAEQNKEILVLQTSLPEPSLAPEQPGKARATLFYAGWLLTPEGNDLNVTYLVKIALNGALPLAMVAMVATEIPLCTGKARDVYQTVGHPPFVRPKEGQSDIAAVFLTETFGDPNPFEPREPSSLEWQCDFLPEAGAEFDIVYDAKRMYAGGVDFLTSSEEIVAEDDGKGRIAITCTMKVEGGITLRPKD